MKPEDLAMGAKVWFAYQRPIFDTRQALGQPIIMEGEIIGIEGKEFCSGAIIIKSTMPHYQDFPVRRWPEQVFLTKELIVGAAIEEVENQLGALQTMLALCKE